MKSFQDFANSINWDTVEDDTIQAFDDINKPMSQEEKNTFDLMRIMAVLKQYHLWLNQNDND